MLVFSVFFASHVVVSFFFFFFSSFTVPIVNCNSPIIDFWHIPKKILFKKQRPVLGNSFYEVAYLCWPVFYMQRAFVHLPLMRRSWFLYARWLFFPCVISSISVLYMNYRPISCFATPKVFRLLPLIFPHLFDRLFFFFAIIFPWTILYELHFVNFHYDWSLRFVHSTVKYLIIYRFNWINCFVAIHTHTQAETEQILKWLFNYRL